ncbi:MAG TPA: CPBP family intramembrane glutamic endopeptidase [Gammaproteobacteria bacterium]|nr:CPBP family intramembrane glutamic endopeptidase [Gammaproteobacteria bacterium]
MVFLETGTSVVFGLLTASIIVLWLPQRFYQAGGIPLWIIFGTLSGALGLYYGIAAPGGILYLLMLAACCYLLNKRDLHAYLRALNGLAIVGLVAGLFLHMIPFFNNPLVFDNLHLSDQSSAYTKYWSFDKAAAGLILLAYFGAICRSGHDWKILARKSYIISAATIFLTLALALLLGYIKPDIKFTHAYFAWAWADLFFTCIPEEMLFRGFLQNHLASFSRRNAYQAGITVFVGILFGLAHAGGGLTYAALACVAGVGYGFAYQVTGKIESAILTHFLLNTAHFLLFTYPLAYQAAP